MHSIHGMPDPLGVDMSLRMFVAVTTTLMFFATIPIACGAKDDPNAAAAHKVVVEAGLVDRVEMLTGPDQDSCRVYLHQLRLYRPPSSPAPSPAEPSPTQIVDGKNSPIPEFRPLGGAGRCATVVPHAPYVILENAKILFSRTGVPVATGKVLVEEGNRTTVAFCTVDFYAPQFAPSTFRAGPFDQPYCDEFTWQAAATPSASPAP